MRLRVRGRRDQGLEKITSLSITCPFVLPGVRRSISTASISAFTGSAGAVRSPVSAFTRFAGLVVDPEIVRIVRARRAGPISRVCRCLVLLRRGGDRQVMGREIPLSIRAIGVVLDEGELRGRPIAWIRQRIAIIVLEACFLPGLPDHLIEIGFGLPLCWE